MTRPGDLRRLAVSIATEVGDAVFAARSSLADHPQGAAKSTSTDLVTQFDRDAESRVLGRLRTEAPDDGVVGEEGAAHTGTSGRTWFVDPIDGTTNFVYGLPGYAVSIAVWDEQGPLAGAVHVPAIGEVFSAARGEGADLNGRTLRVAPTDTIGDALVATGFAYRADRRAEHAAHVAAMLPHIRDIRRLGASSVDLCNVAAGRVDAYVERHLGPWDIAAGALIALEAGAVLSDYAGGPWSHHEMVAAAPGVHTELLRLLASTDPGSTAAKM